MIVAGCLAKLSKQPPLGVIHEHRRFSPVPMLVFLGEDQEVHAASLGGFDHFSGRVTTRTQAASRTEKNLLQHPGIPVENPFVIGGRPCRCLERRSKGTRRKVCGLKRRILNGLSRGFLAADPGKRVDKQAHAVGFAINLVAKGRVEGLVEPTDRVESKDRQATQADLAPGDQYGLGAAVGAARTGVPPELGPVLS